MAKKRTNGPDDRRKDRGATEEPASPPARRSPWKVIAVVLIGGVAIAGAVVIEMDRSKPAAEMPAPSGPVRVPAPMPPPGGGAVQSIPQPPGEVPPGKVWSPEHGHWHDAATGR